MLISSSDTKLIRGMLAQDNSAFSAQKSRIDKVVGWDVCRCSSHQLRQSGAVGSSSGSRSSPSTGRRLAQIRA